MTAIEGRDVTTHHRDGEHARPSYHEARVNLIIGTGHFFSHFYQLCLPPLFLVWQSAFHISFAQIGIAAVLMMGTSAVLQTPAGFLVDRYGARPFLIGGALLMCTGICAMALVTSFWQILVLSFLSGVGNAVFHPCDYAILAGSIPSQRMGRSFALHSFAGNLGSAAAPPAVALLLTLTSWRPTLFIIGLAGIPVVAALLWQSGILQEQSRRPGKGSNLTMTGLLLNRTLGLFFMFYFLGAMASGGISAWAITILHQLKGLDLAAAATALTAYMIGNSAGVFLGGYAADRYTRHLGWFVAVTTFVSGLTIVALNVSPVSAAAAMAMLFVSGTTLGASRTPRDVMLKEIAPPSQLGKVFGFVSAGLPLGSAVTPIPLGYLIDHGLAQAVFFLTAACLLGSLLCMGGARSLRPIADAA